MKEVNEIELKNLPWSFDDIYLKDSTKQIRAVCSNAKIAKSLSEVVNSKADALNIDQRLHDFIQSAYVLQVMIGKAKIEIKDINTMFLEKAYLDFSQKLEEIFKFFNLKIKDDIERASLKDESVKSNEKN